MSTPTNPRREHPSTYFVQDRSSQDELTRLYIQDDLVTRVMGGVLPEQPSPEKFRRVLDIGCGTGGWLIEVAKAYPTITLLIGVDISSKMIEFAQNEAASQKVADRVQFRTMDALRVLEFPTDYFDLVNMRFAVSYLRTWDWPRLLQEFQRITRPGGIIRLTEADIVQEADSPAYAENTEIALDAFYQAGHIFDPNSKGIANELPRLLSRYGLEEVQVQDYTLEYRAGTEMGDRFVEDMKLGLRNGIPFFRKWSRKLDRIEPVIQQTLLALEQPDFFARAHVATAWGRKAGKH